MILAPTLSLNAGSGAAIVRPTFSRDFAGEKTLNNGTGPAITFTRGSQATYFDANGTLRFAPHNAIRNSQAGGSTNGVIGSGGVMPTNWAAVMPVASSLDAEVVGTGTQDGLTYLDVRVFGTNASASVVYPLISFETQTGVTATAGQVWTGSFYAAIVGGSTAGMTSITADVRENTSGGAYVSNGAAAHALTASLQRCSHTRTLTGATTERVNVQLVPFVSGSATIDITFRVAAPQLERNATPSDYIPTTGTANFDQPRFDHSGGTSLGLLIEEARTNSIRNSQGGGSTAGVISSGGVLPTNWTGLATNGIATEVVGTGTENGIAYIDLKYSGTPTASGAFYPTPEAPNFVSASSGQVWTFSAYVKVAAGSTANTVIKVYCSERGSGGGDLANTGVTITPTTASLASQRVSVTRTFNNGSTNFALGFLGVDYTSGQAINITLRIAAPQLEQGAFPASYIPTTSAAVTRSADSAVVTPISSFYNQAQGTLFAEASRTHVAKASSFLLMLKSDEAPVASFVNLESGVASPAQQRFQVAGGTGGALLNFADGAANTVYRMAGAYALNDFIGAQNGTLTSADTSGTAPATLDRMTIGMGATTAVPFYGGSQCHIRKIAYYPKRLSNALLQSLTT